MRPLYLPEASRFREGSLKGGTRLRGNFTAPQSRVAPAPRSISNDSLPASMQSGTAGNRKRDRARLRVARPRRTLFDPPARLQAAGEHGGADVEHDPSVEHGGEAEDHSDEIAAEGRCYRGDRVDAPTPRHQRLGALSDPSEAVREGAINSGDKGLF